MNKSSNLAHFMPTKRRVTSFLTLVTFVWTSLFGLFPTQRGIQAAQAQTQKKKKDKKEGESSSDRTSIAVLGFRISDAKLEGKVRSYISKEFQRTKRLKVAPAKATKTYAERLLEEENREAQLHIQKARKSFAEGKKLYENLAIDEAIKAFFKSVDVYRKGIGSLENNEYLLKSHLYLAMALHIRGRKADAEKYLREKIILDPLRARRELSKKEFPPRIVKLHASIAKKVSSGPKGIINFRTTPGGATIFFDAVQQPVSPHVIEGVPVGEHFVVYKMKGYRRYAKRITVKPGINEVQAKLVAFNPVAPYAFERRNNIKVNEVLVQAGTDLSSSLLVLGDLVYQGKSNLTLVSQIYDVRSREFSKIVLVKSTRGKIKKGSRTVAKELLKNITKDGLVVPQLGKGDEKLPQAYGPLGGSTPTRSKEKKGGIFSKWWLWAIVAGVAGAAAAGVIIGVGGGSDGNVLEVPNPL